MLTERLLLIDTVSTTTDLHHLSCAPQRTLTGRSSQQPHSPPVELKKNKKTGVLHDGNGCIGKPRGGVEQGRGSVRFSSTWYSPKTMHHTKSLEHPVNNTSSVPASSTQIPGTPIGWRGIRGDRWMEGGNVHPVCEVRGARRRRRKWKERVGALVYSLVYVAVRRKEEGWPWWWWWWWWWW